MIPCLNSSSFYPLTQESKTFSVSKLALFLNLKEESVDSQCINQLFKSSKIGYVRAATHITADFPKKNDDLGFSGFQSPYCIFNAFQSILLRICNAGRGLSKHHEASIHD